MAADPPKSDTSRGALLAVVIATAVGALLRLATIAELPLIVMPDSSWFPDDKGYLVWASSILESGDFAGPAVRTPGYPLLIAVTYFLLGISGPAVLIAQHVMGLATVALLTLMAARIAGPWIALVTGCLAALDPWHLLVAHYALSEASMVFAVVAAAAAVVLPRERSWRQALALGILAGVTCLVRPSGEIWIPFLGLAVLLRGPWRMRELARPALAFAGGLALSAGPWLVFNFSRGIHGFAVGEAPVLFTTSAYHGILDERCIPADAAPEVRATFVQIVGSLATEKSATQFFEACRATKLSWSSRARWSRDSIRADPLRYLTAVWHTFRWLLNVGHPAHPRIFDELPYWVRRLTLDGTLENNQAANFQGGILEPEMAEKFRMAPGRADSFAARYLRPWGTRGTRGIPQVPLVILALAAGAVACLRRRWSEATLLAGSLAFVLAHALILYPWQRYSLPSQMLWYLSIPVLVAAFWDWRSRTRTHPELWARPNGP